MDKVQVNRIVVPNDHRELKPWVLKDVLESMKDHGYNRSYPITGEWTNEHFELTDGNHRLVAAQILGIDELPCVGKPESVSRITHAIHCNADQLLGTSYDVFDYARYCWQKAQEGWTGQEIGEALGWSEGAVSRHKAIKEKLHPQAWNLARGFPKDLELGNMVLDDLGNLEFPKGNWNERHFRALLKHLAYENGDSAVYRAQMQAIRDTLERFNQKDKRFGNTRKTVTAKWIDGIARKHAWHAKLAKFMRDNLVDRVPLRDWIDLLKNIRNGVFGNRETDGNHEKFITAISRLNEQALGVTLYEDDALQRIPLLDDGSVALVVTDPPYNVTDHEWDKVGTDDEYLQFLQDWLRTLRPKLTDDYHFFLFCDPDYQARIEDLLVSEGWPMKSRIVWWNRSLPSGRQPSECFARTWQMIFHCGTHPLNWPPEWSGDDRFDVQVYAAPNRNMDDGGWHPTPKPEPLIEHLVRLGSKPTDIILDPFAGGGTTGAACGTVGQRRCILIEKEDQFCTAIENRLGIQREEQ